LPDYAIHRVAIAQIERQQTGPTVLMGGAGPPHGLGVTLGCELAADLAGGAEDQASHRC
jgi:hypothetical protein